MQYDLLIKNGYVVDYASAREGYMGMQNWRKLHTDNWKCFTDMVCIPERHFRIMLSM